MIAATADLPFSPFPAWHDRWCAFDVIAVALDRSGYLMRCVCGRTVAVVYEHPVESLPVREDESAEAIGAFWPGAATRGE